MDEDGLTLEKAADLAVVKWKWLVNNPHAEMHGRVPLASLRELKDGCGWCQYSEEVTGVSDCRGSGPKRCDVCPLRDDDVRDTCCNEWEAGDRKAMLLRVTELQLSVKAQLAWENEQPPGRPFKVGDVVRVRQDAGDKSVYDGHCDFHGSMAPMRGREFEIVRVEDYDCGKEHNQRIYHAGWYWVPDWLEPVDLSTPTHKKPYGWVYHMPTSATFWDDDIAELNMECASHGLVHPVDEDVEWDWEWCTIATFWPWPEGYGDVDVEDKPRRRIILEENEDGEFEVVEE